MANKRGKNCNLVFLKVYIKRITEPYVCKFGSIQLFQILNADNLKKPWP